MNDIVLYILTVLVLMIVDLIYHYIYQSVYQPIYTLSANASLNYFAVVFSWMLVIGGIQMLVLSRPDATILTGGMYGSAFGFTIYGIHNMMNKAIFNDNWPSSMAAIDTLWGTILGGLFGGSMVLIKNLI
jgi:uncharacterized membrane protein